MGGLNQISCSNNNGANLRAVTGYFSTGIGYNRFNVNSSSAYHYAGSFPGTMGFEDYAGYNCFQLDSVNSDLQENVGCTSFNCGVIYEYYPIYCSIYETEDFLVFDLGGGNYDTVYVNGGGYGGGESNSKFQMSNFNVDGKEHLQSQEIMSLDELYGSICLETRRRNYVDVYEMSQELLNNYPDSVQSLDAAMKLYLASLVLDSNGNKMSNLKTFYESLILENGENEYLVKKLFYLVQKCKVALHQYQSALTGFQEIINENPYNYDGLLASWDYAATYLLDSSNGSGGGISNYQLSMNNVQLEDLQSQIRNTNF